MRTPARQITERLWTKIYRFSEKQTLRRVNGRARLSVDLSEPLVLIETMASHLKLMDANIGALSNDLGARIGALSNDVGGRIGELGGCIGALSNDLRRRIGALSVNLIGLELTHFHNP